ncbi:MAG: hypothetical protein BroJett030_31870 [Alphaproteobacteria bacterium]|nr:MAG: hypothetical protein BroJett030_31870 [Alphaproteobacteria bacterium]
MRWRAIVATMLVLPLLVLAAGCIRSEAPFFADVTAATPLPDSFVLASEVDGRRSALRFDRQGDAYLASENGRVTRYRLLPLEPVDGRRFFIGMETSDRDPGAYYGLVEIVGEDDVIMHVVEADQLAAELGLSVQSGDGVTTFASQADLVAVMQRAAAEVVASEGRYSRFDVLDLADPDQRAKGERLLAQTAEQER